MQRLLFFSSPSSSPFAVLERTIVRGAREREREEKKQKDDVVVVVVSLFFLLRCSARLDPFLSPVYSERCKEWTEGKWREVNSDTVKHFHSSSKQMSARVGETRRVEKKVARTYINGRVNATQSCWKAEIRSKVNHRFFASALL